jgi:hypothetical protein
MRPSVFVCRRPLIKKSALAGRPTPACRAHGGKTDGEHPQAAGLRHGRQDEPDAFALVQPLADDVP